MKYIFIIVLLLLCPFYVFASDKIDINLASPQQLDEITGIGPALAQRIINARPFSSINDLLRVQGIGEKTLQKIKDQRLAYVEDQIQKSPQGVNLPPNTPKQTDIIYPGGIYINEILPNPEGPDETDEWIELYNSNGFEADLSGWQIKDIKGTTATYTIPKNIKVSAGGYLAFKRSDTKIMLNNDGDGLYLLDPDKRVVDEISFTKAPLGQSYCKANSGWQWSTSISPGAKNIIITFATNILPKIKKSDNNSIVERKDLTADLNQILNQDTKTANPWFLFFSVLTITIISATIVLILKLRFRKITPKVQ